MRHSEFISESHSVDYKMMMRTSNKFRLTATGFVKANSSKKVESVILNLFQNLILLIIK